MSLQEFFASRVKTLSAATWDRFIRAVDADIADLKERASAQDVIVNRLEARGLQIIEELVSPVAQSAQDRVDEIDALITEGTDNVNGFVSAAQTTIDNLAGNASAAVDDAEAAAAAIAAILADLQDGGVSAALVIETASRVFVTPAQKAAYEAYAAAIALKAAIASPTFTGTPAAPTAAGGTNTTQLATTAFVRGEIAALLNGAPSQLDTLNELAAALDNSASFASTVTAALSARVRFDVSQSLSSGEKAQARANIGVEDAFPSGTSMLFRQTSAPTGWTKDTTHNDKALRVVSGTASSGGTNSFSTVMAQTATGNKTLATGEIPSHPHDVRIVNAQALTNEYEGIGTDAYYTPATGTGRAIYANLPTSSVGGSGPHNHGLTMAIQYVDVIIATKN